MFDYFPYFEIKWIYYHLHFIGLELSWCVVFFCRLWWAWLQHASFSNASETTKRKTKYTHFITKTSYLSVEINAHMLVYVILLVKNNQLPKEALHIYLFNSQSCESMFRNARSLTRVYSTKVNFTVTDFLRRSQKLSVLNKIKHKQENNKNERILLFPIHHKHKNGDHLVINEKIGDIYGLDIEKIVLNSYKMAIALIEPFNVIPLLKQHHVIELHSLSKYIFSQLDAQSRMTDYSRMSTTNSRNSLLFELDTDDDEYDEDDYLNNNSDLISDICEDNDDLNESRDDDQEEDMSSIKNDFNGLKIRNNINPKLKDRYFKIKINDTVRYLHKQTACWILTNENGRLSADRLCRVIQTNRK